MSAVISECGKYRYMLRRAWGDGRTVAFIGVNPSTADASLDDATVRKWRGFAQRWGYDGFVVGNLFAYRSTDVRALAAQGEKAVGPNNDSHLVPILTGADLIVPCWGSRSKLPKVLHYRIEQVRGLLRAARAPVRVLGLTSSNDPMHPLMLGYETALVDWTP